MPTQLSNSLQQSKNRLKQPLKYEKRGGHPSINHSKSYFYRLASLDGQQADHLFKSLLIAQSLLQLSLIAFSQLGLAPDEAHYWEWSRRLDLSYYSKGPLIAWIIRSGTWLLGHTELGVRIGAFFCYLTFSTILFFFLKRQARPGIAFASWLIFSSMLIFAQMGLVMTTDGPGALCWLLALIAGQCALEKRPWWIAWGFFCGIGILAKYTVAILPISTAAFLLFTSSRRTELRTAWFWLGLLTCLITTSPIIVWNIQHGWVNIAHNAGHLGAALSAESASRNHTLFRPRFFGELIGGQLGLVGLFVLPLLLWALARGFKWWRAGDETAGYFAFSVAPLLLVCVVVSLTRSVYANWPLPAYVGLIALTSYMLDQEAVLPNWIRRWFGSGLALNAFLLAVAYLLYLGFAPPYLKILPTTRLMGWEKLGSIVDAALSEQLTRQNNVRLAGVLSDEYGLASEIAFYSKHHPRVYCAVLGDRRMNQYDIWGGWAELKGKDLLIVLKEPASAEALAPHFASFAPLSLAKSENRSVPAPQIELKHGTTAIRSVFIYLGKGYDGFVPPTPQRR